MLKSKKIITLLVILTMLIVCMTPSFAADILITNHSFESNLTGWTQTHGTGGISVVTEKAFIGSKSCKIIDTSTTDAFGLESAKISATAGTTYVAFANVFVVNSSADLYIRFYNSSDTYLGTAFASMATTGQWETIQIKMTAPANTAKVAVLLYSSKGANGTAYWDNAMITKTTTNLGAQVYDSAPNGATFGIGANQNKIYAAYTGAGTTILPKMSVINVDAETISSTITFPSDANPAYNPTGAWAATTATDGNVYFGTYSDASLYKYVPGGTSLTKVGKPISSESIIYDLKAGLNGKVYGGTYGNCGFFKYQPNSFTTIGTLPFAAGCEYIRCLAYDPIHNVTYLGVGTNAQVIRFDNVTGSKNNILPSKWVNSSLPGYLDYTGDRVFTGISGVTVVQQVIENSDGSFNSVINDAEIPYTSSHVSPEYSGKVYVMQDYALTSYDIASKAVTTIAPAIDYGGRVKRFGWADLADDTNWPGMTLVGVVAMNSRTHLMKYNPQNGNYRLAELSNTPVLAGKINTIAGGPDGKIYTSAYLTGGLGVYTPIRGDSNDSLHEQMYYPITQIDKMASLNGKLYIGAYPGAKLYEYDPSQPWDIEGNINPRLLVSGTGQDRPRAIAYGNGKVFMGTVAGTGKMDGALIEYELSTGTTQINTGIINDQSIISLAYYNGKVYGGSSIRGGYATTPTTTEPKLFIYDPATGTKTNEFSLPVSGLDSITEMIVVNNKIWGFAGGYLFVFNPTNNTFEYFQQKFTDVDYGTFGTYNDAHLLTVEKDPNYIYGTIHDKYLFKINISTKAVTNIVTTGADYIGADGYGNLYYRAGEINLMRYSF